MTYAYAPCFDITSKMESKVPKQRDKDALVDIHKNYTVISPLPLASARVKNFNKVSEINLFKNTWT